MGKKPLFHSSQQLTCKLNAIWPIIIWCKNSQRAPELIFVMSEKGPLALFGFERFKTFFITENLILRTYLA
jgi:hypothetical protein